ncbi:hypothetical protein NPIL_53671 [Nephila pilipes]|uniref:Uncharacterized protein n=1 Tax=Nephila pilipes TaxID=299642 RepID=A0A8X6TZQ1_NEPPI|nr:hypothetical protein NPIL_53671 [Nephila pilipes]
MLLEFTTCFGKDGYRVYVKVFSKPSAYNSDFSNLSKGYKRYADTFGISTHFQLSAFELESFRRRTRLSYLSGKKGNRIRMDMLKFRLLPWGNVFSVSFVRQIDIKDDLVVNIKQDKTACCNFGLQVHYYFLLLAFPRKLFVCKLCETFFC